MKSQGNKIFKRLLQKIISVILTSINKEQINEKRLCIHRE